VPSRPGEAGVTDITYLPNSESWPYLAGREGPFYLRDLRLRNGRAHDGGADDGSPLARSEPQAAGAGADPSFGPWSQYCAYTYQGAGGVVRNARVDVALW
jgi:hypothetical protein